MRHPFLRTLAGSAATPTDPNFENVTLLLHGDGTNGGQNNTFVDGSTNNFTITRNGNTTQGTFSPYGDLWSNYFDGTGDFLRLPSSSAFSIATSTTPFSIECWIYPTAAGGALFAEQYEGSGGNVDIAISMSGSTTNVGDTTGRYIGFGWHTHPNWTTAAMSNTQVALHQWTHVACVFTGSTSKIYLNGVDSTASTPTPATTWGRTGSSGNEWYVGRRWDGASIPHFTGYISNLRFVNGTAVYTSNFTPSSTPLTAITNTSLLTCQSNRFRDASTNNFAITRNGDVSVQRFSPFSPTAAYAAGTIGGSGYFDGSGDYLSIPTGAFSYASGTAYTLELWFFATSYPTQYPQIIGASAASGSNTVSVYLENNGRVAFGQANVGDVLSSASGAIQLNAWNHIAVGKNSSNSARMWVNGTSVATATDTKTYAAAATLSGQNPTGTQRFAGYISDLRSVNGSDVYGSSNTTITVPTAPLSAATNTQLLLNFTNAAILDNAMMAVPETVGNAQISTSVKKYGTGSLAFDGTGDWLLVPDSIDQRLGTGNFTIECWLYLSATGTARGIVGKGTSTTGWLLSTNTSNAVVFTYGTSTITSTGTLAGTTWYHIAVVREGTGTNQTKIYIGGTNDGTGTVSTDFTQTNAAYIGANRTGGDPMNGFIDDLRITKGVARYTATFTPPTAAFPDL